MKWKYAPRRNRANRTAIAAPRSERQTPLASRGKLIGRPSPGEYPHRGQVIAAVWRSGKPQPGQSMCLPHQLAELDTVSRKCAQFSPIRVLTATWSKNETWSRFITPNARPHATRHRNEASKEGGLTNQVNRPAATGDRQIERPYWRVRLNAWLGRSR